MNIPPEHEEEFNRWYNTEHIKERVDIPGFFSGRRYRSLEGEPKYFALYELEEPDVVHRPAYTQVRENPTPWTHKMEAIFQNFVRNIYEKMSSSGQRLHLATRSSFSSDVRALKGQANTQDPHPTQVSRS